MSIRSHTPLATRQRRSGTARPGRIVATLAAAGLVVLALPVGLAPADAATGRSPVIDLRADTNRDGTVDITGTSDEAVEGTARALFLPNLDDDTSRCRNIPTGFRSDKRLDACNDAADRVVNGRNDERDLARIRLLPVADLPRGAVGRLQVSNWDKVNVFVRSNNRWQIVSPDTTFSTRQLAAGLEFGVEGRDIVRDSAAWDGTITVGLNLNPKNNSAQDSVTLQVAPMLTHTHTQTVNEVAVMAAPQSDPFFPDFPEQQAAFNRDLAAAVKGAGVAAPVRELKSGFDRWVQDYFEPMYASMPGPDGVQSMRLLLRSDQDRPASRALYRQLRGPDVGVIWMGTNAGWASRDSFGNLETIPAHSHNGRDFPAGRIIYGEDRRPGAFDNMSERLLAALRAQGQQDPLALDTSFLAVGHVDEMMQFLPADTPRGWKVAVTDTAAGLELLRQAQAAGKGGSTVVDHPDESLTIDEALSGGEKDIVADNERAGRIIEANLDKVKAATGITEDEVVRIPGVYADPCLIFECYDVPEGDSVDGSDSDRSGILTPETEEGLGLEARLQQQLEATRGSVPGSEERSLLALVPNAINGIVVNGTVVVPKQFGVKVDGRDLFADAVEKAYRDAGMEVTFVDGWIYHQGWGEIHCGTNTLRDTTAPWWRTVS